jgi:hypothetical protein
MARTAKVDIESRWYDVFTGWPRADREIALRVLTELHKRLPEPKKAKGGDAEKPDADPQGSLIS